MFAGSAPPELADSGSPDDVRSVHPNKGVSIQSLLKFEHRVANDIDLVAHVKLGTVVRCLNPLYVFHRYHGDAVAGPHGKASDRLSTLQASPGRRSIQLRDAKFAERFQQPPANDPEVSLDSAARARVRAARSLASLKGLRT